MVEHLWPLIRVVFIDHFGSYNYKKKKIFNIAVYLSVQASYAGSPDWTTVTIDNSDAAPFPTKANYWRPLYLNFHMLL